MVRAFTNAWGDFTLREDVVELVTYYRNGQIWNGNQYPNIARDVELARSIRDWPSYNRGHTIPGTTTVWLPPSTYERHVTNTHYISGYTFRWFIPNDISVVRAGKRQSSLGHSPFLRHWPTLAPKAIWDDNQFAEAQAKAYSKIADGKAALGENLATAVQTSEMFAGAAVPLIQALIAAKHGNWRKVYELLGLSYSYRNLGKYVTGLRPLNWYIEYIFGWAPLMQDVSGLGDLLKEKCQPALTLTSGRASSSDTETAWKGPWNGTLKGSSVRKHICSMTGKISSQTLRDVNRMGLANPLSVAWELLPWSFIIDWVAPIGNVLDSLTAPCGLDFVGGYNSCVVKGSFEAIEPRNGTETYSKDFGCQWEGFSYKRVPLGDWPRPIFYTKSPFSKSHALTALALLRQLA